MRSLRSSSPPPDLGHLDTNYLGQASGRTATALAEEARWAILRMTHLVTRIFSARVLTVPRSGVRQMRQRDVRHP
jgi:hypothetical protein